MGPGPAITARLLRGSRSAEEIREAVYLSTGDVAAKQTRFWLLLTLAAVIATAGIVGDSTATVIGAMIIAPLATPIQGIALAIAYGEPAATWTARWARLLLYLTNVLAIVVVGIVLFSALRIGQGQLRDAGFRARPVLVVVATGAIVVVAALTILTVRTVQLSNRLDAATGVASSWAAQHEERMVDARFDGTTLVLIVEGTTDGAQDPELLDLLDGAVPSGTDVVVDRVPGRRSDIGSVR